MRNVVLKMSISIDGFVGGPNGELDWIFRSMDAETSKEPFAPPMNEIPKAVFSRSGRHPTARAFVDARAQATTPTETETKAIESWRSARVITGDLAEGIACLEQEPGKDIYAHGGATFARSLVRLDLVDEYRLLVHPVALGRGLPLLSELTAPIDLQLTDVKRFAGGAVAHVYRKRVRS